MLKKLLPLSLLLVSQKMVAGSPDSHTGDSYPCGCEMPCIPDCYCYVPQFYDLQCDSGISLSADFLYWYARENRLAYAEVGNVIIRGDGKSNTSGTTIVPSAFTNEPLKDKYLDTKWAPAFRLGLGWNLPCDGWEIDLSWTWYQNSKHASVSQPDTDPVLVLGDMPIINPWQRVLLLDATTLPIQNISNFFDQVSAHWRFHLNELDLSVNRRFWLSKCLYVKPYIGVAAAWTHTSFQTHSTKYVDRNVLAAGVARNFVDTFKNKFNGIGLLTGFESTWSLGCGFSLYGDINFSLLQGRFKGKKSDNYFEAMTGDSTQPIGLPDTITPIALQDGHFKKRYFGMQPIVDFQMGFRYEDYFCCKEYYLAIDLGWEQQMWFNHNTRNKYFNAYVSDSQTGGISTPTVSGRQVADLRAIAFLAWIFLR